MSYNIMKTHIREVDPQNEEQLLALSEKLNHADYLQQSPTQTLPKTIEPEFAEKDFLTWAYQTIHEKYPDSNFRYAVVDHDFEPVNPEGKKLTVPYSYISLFDYKGKTYAGPLFLGIIPCVLQAKGDGYPEAYKNLGEQNSQFTAQDQQRIAQQSIEGLLEHPHITGGVIAAIPNSRQHRGSRAGENEAPDLRYAGYFHLMVGGQIKDQYNKPEDFRLPDDESKKAGDLRSKPVSFTRLVGDNTDAYVVFPLLKGSEGELLSDVDFCRLCHDIRILGPEYQKAHPQRPEGIQATVSEGLSLMKELTRLGTSGKSSKTL